MTAPARPAAGPLTGYATGVVIALFPNLLPRSVVVQVALVLALGLAGAAAGALAARAGRGRASSDTLCLFTIQLISAALVGWALWQNALRAAAGAAPVPPIGFLALAVVALAAPYLGAALRPVRRRATVVAVTAVVAAATIAWPASAAEPSASYAQRFAAIESATPGIRVYASRSDGATPAGRAEAAVDRLVESGGIHRRAVVVTVPTGSGWVDPHVVRGVEETLHGDSAVVAVQYTEQPSWQSFLLHRDAAAAGAVALIEALHRRAPALRVYLYGQSLGAVGVVAARRRAAELGMSIAGTLQAGTPADVPLVGPAQLNASDPVGIWSPLLLVTPPRRAATPPGRATPRPPWLPVVSFVQATVDLLGATAPPPGLGHRYDEHQGSDLVRDLIPNPLPVT